MSDGYRLLFLAAAASAGQAFCIDCVRSYLDARYSKNVASIVDTGLHGLLAGTIWAAASALLSDATSPSVCSTLSRCFQMDRAGFLLELRKPSSHLNSLFCAFFASALDLDHFLAAGSLTMHGAMNLPTRPFGHSVTFAVTTVAVVWALTRSLWDGAFSHWPALLLVAWGSHQLRDAVRRGLWFWPIGSTPQIPYALYLLLVACMPSLAAVLVRYGRGVGPSGSGMGSPHRWLDKHGGFNQAWEGPQGLGRDDREAVLAQP